MDAARVKGGAALKLRALLLDFFLDADRHVGGELAAPLLHDRHAGLKDAGLRAGEFHAERRTVEVGELLELVLAEAFRVELGEIAAALRQLPSVAQVAVMARTDFLDGDKRLVAYVVSEPGTQLRTSELRSFLKERLPDYMVPQEFVFLDKLPLTPHGKVNYRAFPPPDQSHPELEKTYVPPRTEVEEALVGIWAEVLRLEKVGVYDSFFDLGGHSLLATKIMARVQKRFQLQIPLRSFFEAPTVAGLALAVVQSRAGQFDSQEMLQILADLEGSPEEESQSMVNG